MNIKKVIRFVVIILISVNFSLIAQKNIWLSNTPPREVEKKIEKTGMRRLPVIYGKRHQANIIQWIRSGELPATSEYVKENALKNPQLFIFDEDGKEVKGELLTNDLGFIITFPATKDGYYLIYLLQKYVKDDTLNISVAKVERMFHSCRNGHDKALIRVEAKTYPEQIPIEIVRERLRGENLHTVIHPGDDVTFQVLLNKNPVEKSIIQMATQKGWIKKEITDNNGEATFQFIKDNITKMQELRRRAAYNYIITFQKIIKQEGTFDNQKYSYINYTTTFSDNYTPSRAPYSSFVWALFVVLGSIILISLGIYFYRKKHKVEYKEIALNE